MKLNFSPNSSCNSFTVTMLENIQNIGAEIIDINVSYFLDQEKQFPLLQNNILKLKHLGNFSCNSCHKITKKLFEGFCFPCFKYKACADRCIMSPHLCHYQAGTCREPKWGDSYCYQPHYLYLSYTDKFKIGLTRENQIPTRWVDQGATAAAILAKVTSRHQAGLLEQKLKEIIPDKSHWLNMIKNGNNKPTIAEFKETQQKILAWMASENICNKQQFIAPTPTHLSIENKIILFKNPVIVYLSYPFPNNINKFKSINLEKTPEFQDEILGIKGQYIIFKELVFNMRRHEGFIVDLEIF